MRTCNYCHTSYSHRPQVTNPQACKKEECQQARQRDNEKRWKEKNKHHYSKDYYELQRDKRSKAISARAKEVMDCLEVGKKLLNKAINLENFNKHFMPIFSQLGIRFINKLWNSEDLSDSHGLESHLSPL